MPACWKSKTSRPSDDQTDDVNPHQTNLDGNVFRSSTLVPGGCALNTCRVLCWLDAEDALDSKFFGSIGRDDHGTALTSKIKESGILPR